MRRRKKDEGTVCRQVCNRKGRPLRRICGHASGTGRERGAVGRCAEPVVLGWRGIGVAAGRNRTDESRGLQIHHDGPIAAADGRNRNYPGNRAGRGSGYGNGDDSGSGYGDGSGNVGCISSINGMHVYNIDGVPTVIAHAKGNIAKGWILENDLTLNPCYIAKQDNMFAHGDTLRDAMEALEEKLFDDMSEGERIGAFLDAVEDGPEYPARLFFDWHGRLTGSCHLGRETFVKNHGIVLDKDTMTLKRFLELTREDYGGDTIRRIEDIIK